MLLFSQERDGFGSALRSGRVRGRGDWTMGSPGPLQEVTYTIPADKCGLVIGKGRKLSLLSLVRKLKVRKTFTLLSFMFTNVFTLMQRSRFKRVPENLEYAWISMLSVQGLKCAPCMTALTCCRF